MPVGANPLIEVVPGLMIWTLICFGITFFVLRRYAFGPVQKIIDERRARIRESLVEAERAREESRKLLEEHRALRAQARSEAEEILSEARRVAESVRERVKQEADADRERRLEETRRQIEAETARAIGEIRAEVAELAIVAAERVTRQRLDREADRTLIEDALRDLDFSALEKETA